jgi:hypothetical protein
LTERSLKLTERSLKLTECSLKLTERSPKLSERCLKLTECSLKLSECSLNVPRSSAPSRTRHPRTQTGGCQHQCDVVNAASRHGHVSTIEQVRMPV